MKVKILPKSNLGKWSVGFLIGMVIFYMLFFGLVASGQRGSDTFFSNLTLTIPMILVGISGISAFFTGIIGLIKNGDFNILVIISTIIGLFVLIFILGELLLPH